MLQRLVLAVSIFLLSISSLQAAGVPRSAKEIPIYPGAVRDRDAERQEADEGMYSNQVQDDSEENPRVLRSADTSIHTVAASAEAVLRFYLKALGGQEGDIYEHLDTASTAPGKVSKVYYEIRFVDFSPYRPKDAAEWKAKLRKVRAPYQGTERWVSTGAFDWEVGDRNGDVSTYRLTVRDDTFHSDDDQVGTTIVITRTTYMNRKDALAALERDDEAEDDEGPGGVALDAQALGVPVYPGAVLDPQTSRFVAQFSKGGGAAYQSKDKVRTIAAFYERAGYKVISVNEEGALLKRCAGRGGCDLDITLQNPWRDMATGALKRSTLISIVRQEP